ncbi:MAG: response regulator [Desulfobacteraceae bacterium]|nr:response regulator [Desulfobacteraceae bacterium]
MVSELSELEEVNVLASEAEWGWPVALSEIFRPCGVNLMVARGAGEFVDVIRQKRIHTTIVDVEAERATGMTTLKIIRKHYPSLPCIMLTSSPCVATLTMALRLDVFSVIDKPVDMGVLRGQLNRIFIKKYSSDLFADK